MSNDLPDRYRPYDGDGGADLVSCTTCAEANRIPAAIIPRSAIPEHELWHSGPNARPPAPTSGPWPELGRTQPVASEPLEGVIKQERVDGINLPLTRVQLAKIAAGEVLAIRVTDDTSIWEGPAEITVFVRVAKDREIHVREMREPPYDTAPDDGPLTVDDLPGGVNNPHPGVPARSHATEEDK